MAIFLDANIFMYAAGADHPHREPCLSLLEHVASDEPSTEFCSNTEVLQEILHRYLAIGRPELADQVFSNVVSLPIRFFSIRLEEMYLAKRLLSKHPQLSARDAVHAASMKGAEVIQICTYDRGFNALDFLTRIEPESMGFGKKN